MKYVFHSEFSSLPQSSSAAKALNEQFYYTGKPCVNGHLSVRYTSSSNCRNCIEEKRGKTEMNFRGRSSKRTTENQSLAEKALNEGHTTYASVSPCPNGHVERFVTTNNCVQCSKESNKKTKDYRRWKRIKDVYGLEKKDFFDLLLKQKNKCAICETDILKKNHIDHCHSTGKVRGILCNKCNQAIGLMSESADVMKKAIAYLRRNQI